MNAHQEDGVSLFDYFAGASEILALISVLYIPLLNLMFSRFGNCRPAEICFAFASCRHHTGWVAQPDKHISIPTVSGRRQLRWIWWGRQGDAPAIAV
ncbi:hypothetical protein BJ508DRAFT_411232 [Ascobolus immersus RN42]|uniref:Uncharacterized protein n=1 Tax=Ascobolus immersus RN42 TaxID=1160509 RepID=A0A3N4ILJ8_ASCIM|nr:hypothetical protein BJ508DRAFT_411232 [Ascobolus immersus RN42]